MVDSPKISVLMSVFNDERYVGEAIKSILKQTFTNFEFIIINDGSTDRSGEIIKSFTDIRIVYIENKSNIGLTASLVLGLSLAKGKFLARMDSNDISNPKRLETQLKYLSKNENISVCGSSYYVFGDILIPKVQKYPLNHESICCLLLFNSAIPHVTAMFDIQKFREHELNYDINFKAAQDYDLWYRVSKKLKMANLADCLVKVRYLKSGISIVGQETKQSQNADKIRYRVLQDFGIEFSDEEFELHKKICKFSTDGKPDFLYNAIMWLRKLSAHNIQNKKYESLYFNKLLQYYWFMVCRNSGFGLEPFNLYVKNKIDPKLRITVKDKFILLIYCIIYSIRLQYLSKK